MDWEGCCLVLRIFLEGQGGALPPDGPQGKEKKVICSDLFIFPFPIGQAHPKGK